MRQDTGLVSRSRTMTMGLQTPIPGSRLKRASPLTHPSILDSVRLGPVSGGTARIDPEEEDKMPADPKSIVRRLYEEVWNKRKMQLMSELVSPSHALHGPNFSGSSIGPEAYRRHVALFVAGFPDLRFTIEDTVTEGDRVVVCWTLSGTHKGEYMGIPATNKKVSIQGITIHHIANGRIMDSYPMRDMWGMMQQLGVVDALGRPQSTSAR
jgi:steroid delta-isomerase-like uncharacterized protein